MATQPPSEMAELVPEIVVQQTILQQAEAVIAAQTIDSRPTSQEATPQLTDLFTTDVAEDDIPPPAYGESYGEIRREKDGLGTSATITEDGRVNIRINQVNRRLSQIFSPALRQHLQNVEDSQPTPRLYIPPGLGGEEEGLPPPRLNIVIQVVGSRGDVQPFVALGKVLKDTYGHRVRLATHPTFRYFVEENGLEFFSIGGDPSRLMAFMVKNPGLMPGFRSVISGDVRQRRQDVAEYLQGCWRSCFQAGNGLRLDDPSEPEARPFVADCIIANPPSFAHVHCAEKLGIPLHMMFTMPYSPTQAFPHPLANIQSSNADPQLTNYLSYTMIEMLLWQGLGDVINRFRVKCLRLEPVSLIWAPGMLQRLKVPHTYCWSPALIPKPKDWGPRISVSGFCFLNLASNYTPSLDLQAFLDAGPPSVYIGFGSIVLDDPNAMTELIFEAARKTGQRVLLSKGWGGMGADELRVPQGIFMLGNVPHDWLFQRVSCVVHHGGAGTTAAGITAGRPTVVVPFFGDQPFWGAMVARAGAGPDPIPHKQLTADKLANAINFCLKPESLDRAKELASKIAAEQGSDTAAMSFHQYLEPDRLRCTLAPSRSAVWRVKRTNVGLSAFAACTLANADLLDFRDLKLYRPQEYETDEGPWDPISGGFVAVMGAFSDMSLGIFEFPSETVRALQLPFTSSRQQSHASASTTTMKRETSKSGNKPPSFPLPQQSQMGFDGKETLPRSPSRPSSETSPSSRLSSSNSTHETSSMSDAKHGQPSSSAEQNAASRRQDRSRHKSASTKNHDMMRQTGVHTRKGIGRFTKALVQSPMEISMGFTKGFHNLPKSWGDDTVRPQAQVNGFLSGAMAAGKEFGLGWYDGVTGLVTQPWKGARKEGASGFVKGIAKGMGGLVAKPGAALWGVPGYVMKGVHKEVQKVFGSNVQNYIIASRTAQGYEEWLQSSDAERRDVIDRWMLVQKHLKKKPSHDEAMRDVLEAQQKMKNIQDRETDRDRRRTASPIQSTTGDYLDLDRKSALDQRQEAECHESESVDLEYEEQLKQALTQSLREQRQRGGGSEWESVSDYQENKEFEASVEKPGKMAEKTAAVAGPSSCVQSPPSFDAGHLAGTTQSEFEEQQLGRRGEKTAQEQTEEEIVLEYVKKQSLLEQHHRNKGKHRITATEDEEDEALQKALHLSRQAHANDAGNW